jgi:Ca2+-binding RTX toxin-like protein
VISSGFSQMRAGRGTEANGTITISDQAVVSVEGATGSGISLGIRSTSDAGSGGIGLLTISADAVVTVTNTGTTSSAAAGFNLGSYGGSGTLTVDGGTLNFVSASGVYANLGFDGNNAAATPNGGNAMLRVQNGGQINFTKVQDYGFIVGRGQNSDALVEVLTGGVMDLNDDLTGGAYMAIGDRANTTSALVRVHGAGSLIDGIGFLNVGRNSGDPNSNGGNGRLVVESGGEIRAAIGVSAGTGGRISGDNGTITTAFASVKIGGSLGDIGGLIETLAFNFTSGSLSIEAGANVIVDMTSTTNDRWTLTGGGVGLQAASISIAPGTYQFTAGETRTIFDVMTTGGSFLDPSFFSSNVSVQGQHADFGFAFGSVTGSQDIGILALNSGAAGGQAILDFGASSSAFANFDYNSSSGIGRGNGGQFGSIGVVARHVDEVRGTANHDTFNNNGSSGSVTFRGQAGNDTLIGGGGNDTLDGGNDSDSLVGAGGNDSLVGGGGNDNMTGGAGDDVYIVDTLGDVVIELAGGGTLDTVQTSISLTLAAEVENLILTGSGLINGTGNSGNNLITGNIANNILVGGAGSDTMLGGNGNDTIDGGAGKDLFTGGGGLDRFIFSALSDTTVAFAGRDVINTFAHGDKIDLSAIDARTNVAGDQAFTFIGAAGFSGISGQLRFDMTNISPTGVKAYTVYGDVNGDRVGDLSLQIYTAPTADRTGQPETWNLASWDFQL